MNLISNVLIIGLACWRLSSMLVHEDGPKDVLLNIRKRTGIEYDAMGKVTSYPSWNPLYCVWCTSVWTAVALYMLPIQVSAVLAISTIAVALESKLWQEQVQ